MADSGDGELCATAVLSVVEDDGVVEPSVDPSAEVSPVVGVELQPTMPTEPISTKNPTLKIETNFDLFINNL